MNVVQRLAAACPSLPGRLTVPAVLLAAGLTPLAGEAQSAQEIIDRMVEAHDARLEQVEDLTIRQEVMGVTFTSYMVKEVVDGRPILRVRSTGVEERDEPEEEELWTDPVDPWAFYEEGADRWTREGTGSVEGRSTWNLALTDFEGLNTDAFAPDENMNLEPSRIDMDVDQELLVPLLVVMEGEVREEGTARPVVVTMRFSDYRDVEGYLHPFVALIEGDFGAAGMSDAEMEEARGQLEELRAQLQQLPEAQREMMEQMMGEQMQALEEMVESGGFQMEMRVLDLQVNAGPPS